MPFVGPEKAELLRALVAQRPGIKVAVEVGAMAGYSAICIAQVGGPGALGYRSVVVEREGMPSEVHCGKGGWGIAHPA
jgi:predicted O-methyltransferase YrrM